MRIFDRALTFFAVTVAIAQIAGPAPATAAECTYPTKQAKPVLPVDTKICRQLDTVIRNPAGLPTAAYQEKLQDYLGNYCHRDKASGWVRDKYIRDTGPSTVQLENGIWQSSNRGTHAPVVIWYSPEMHAWMKDNRTDADQASISDKTKVPDGAVMVKEMYPAPASVCRDVEPEFLKPEVHGSAIMIKDAKGSYDGWYWGWFGWDGWKPDYPAGKSNGMANLGFGQYCLNCHSSARNNQTFASLKNIQGEAGIPIVFLNQDEEPAGSVASQHNPAKTAPKPASSVAGPLAKYDPFFTEAYSLKGGATAPTDKTVSKLPSETYDHTVVSAGGPTAHDQFLTSDQCLGCHDAGSTGLRFDMTVPVDPNSAEASDGQMWNHSPYGSWRTSPMGLSGRDPIFFSQLASETQTFHPDISPVVQNTCLGCHGILGQRQFGIDHSLGAKNNGQTGKADCGDFTREMVNAVPWPENSEDNPHLKNANYGALARDGISCLACHRMVLGEKASAAVRDQDQNACVIERQDFLNPNLSGFAKTFTGSFLVGDARTIFGPYKNPKTAPMKDALGNTPAHNATLANSETCGTCHTVHLPVFHNGKQVGQVYEQLTYPEWAFSAYRTGETPDGPLPEGQGQLWKSCQGCHMPSTEVDGTPTQSRIASIQEYSNFPQTDFARRPEEIDLPVRDNFARHTLVGLNVFLTKMAQQFPDVLGISAVDPMLGKKGVNAAIFTEKQMLDQAAHDTVDVSIPSAEIEIDQGKLKATVKLINHVGHKFPSGVGFRRAFVSFDVLDRRGNVIWTSGSTDSLGRIIGSDGKPLPGEMWWTPNCSARIAPEERLHQPHYQTITDQNQAQIYQELVSTPPNEGVAQCGYDAKPEGQLTTSFLSICAEVKDNRLLPDGYLPLEKRKAIALALGAKEDMAADAGTTAVGNDPDYADGKGGSDTLSYEIALSDLKAKPHQVRARLWYQATPPFYLQDRFCTASGDDPNRLYYLTGHLNLDGTPADDWKLLIDDTGPVDIRN